MDVDGGENILQGEPTTESFLSAKDDHTSSDDESGARTVKKDNPFILFVHQGEDDRRRIDKRDTWNILMEKITDLCLDLTAKGEPSPNVEWSSYNDGAGAISPADEESREILVELISQTKVCEKVFRAWRKGEEGSHIPVTLRIPPVLHKHTSGKIMQMVALKNKLETDSYIVRAYKDVPKSKDKLLKVSVNKDTLAKIKDLNGQVYVGICKLDVYQGGKPIRSDK